MNNQQISTIVNGMLATAQTKKALSLVAIKNLSSKVNDAEKQRFMTSLELAQLLAQTKEEFENFYLAVKNKLKDGGTTAKEMPQKADFIKLVYGFKASYYYKLIKIGELPKNVVNKFIDKCDDAEKDGKEFSRSIEALNTWAKGFEEHKGNADADAESIADLRNGGEKRVVLWQIKEGNKKLTFYADGTNDCNFTSIEVNAFLDEILIPSIRSTFAIKKATTSKDKKVLTNIQKERVKKMTTSKELV